MANINTLLVILVVIAVIASIGGTLVTISRLQPAWLMVTGEVSTGTLSFELISAAVLNVTQTTVDFGVGKLAGVATTCTIATNDTEDATCGNWTGYWGDSEAFAVMNVGNVDIYVNISSDKNAENFIGGASPTQKYAVEDKDSSPCSGTAQIDWATLQNTSEGSTNVCNETQWEVASNELYVHIQLKIPEDATKTSQSSTITFTSGAS